MNESAIAPLPFKANQQHYEVPLDYPEGFIRMWEYYLCYCEGGFRQQAIGTIQLLLTKPQTLRSPLSSTDY